jgi:twitching motility protein PilT
LCDYRKPNEARAMSKDNDKPLPPPAPPAPREPERAGSGKSTLGVPSPDQLMGAAQRLMEGTQPQSPAAVKPPPTPKKPPPPPPPAEEEELELDLSSISMPPPPPAPPVPPPPPKTPKAPDKLVVKSPMLGTILVDNGFLTPEQRDACLAISSDPSNILPFGEIAVERGYIDRDVLNRVLEAQRRHVDDVQREQSRAVPLPEALNQPLEEEQKQEKEEKKPGEDLRREAGQLLAWLSSTLKHNASDLHLMSGKPLVLRHNGRLMEAKEAPIEPARAEKLLKSILSDEERDRLELERSVTKCVDIKGGARARACIFHHMNGVNGTFRLIPDKVPSLVSLNLPPAMGKLTTYAQGLVLVTGPISSGKTTTLAALVDIINQERYRHIITVEDPIEFVHRNSCSLITQRQVGVHTGGFAVALRASLREDPDVIVVGEMHDRETAQLAVTAAETGHLVFATLHTQSAIRSINRVLDLFPAEEQGQVRTILAESLRGVVSQHLVPRADAPGRVPVTELLFVTPAIRNLIREQKIHQLKNALRISRNVGNMSFEDHATELLEKKIISQQTFDSLSFQ